MQLNLDCVRDVLIVVENLEFREIISYLDIVEKLKDKYLTEDVLYSIRQCQKSEYIISKNFKNFSVDGLVYDLTPKGHEFLANIRNDKLFNKAKDFLINKGLPMTLPAIAKFMIEHSIS